MGGSRGAAWANTFQTLVFMVMGVVAFVFISNSLGGMKNATNLAAKIDDSGNVIQTHSFNTKQMKLIENDPPKIIGKVIAEGENYSKTPLLTRTVTEVELFSKNRKTGEITSFKREYGVPPWMFLTYFFIPLSVGMFPHLFQHWLTAKSAKAFRLTVVAHPLFILIVWVPCVLIGTWATGILPPLESSKVSGVLGMMVRTLVGNPILTGLLTAGILAAIMSSLDSQFLCLGTIFTNDIVIQIVGKDRFTDKQIILIARLFIVGIVVLTYLLSLVAPQNVFNLAIWCFTGFSGLFPLILAAVYWKRATETGAVACIFTTVISWFYFFAQSGYGGEYTIAGGMMPVAFIVIFSSIAMVAVSLLTRPPSKETIQKFFPN
jgi:SSS family solute:Na+ symporter